MKIKDGFDVDEFIHYVKNLKKFEIRTERSTKNKPAHFSRFYYFSIYEKKLERKAKY